MDSSDKKLNIELIKKYIKPTNTQKSSKKDIEKDKKEAFINIEKDKKNNEITSINNSVSAGNGMSWIGDLQTPINQLTVPKQPKSYINAAKIPISNIYKQNNSLQLPLPLPLQISLNMSKQQALSKTESLMESKKRCYTCKPRGKVSMHIISESACGNFIFHHDMNLRPIILVTPKIHISNIYELPSDIQQKLFSSIHDFCNFWNIINYEISWNHGSWQQRSHFHIKIKTETKIIKHLRDTHFKYIFTENRYKNN